MKQSKFMSMVETVLNTAIGFVIAMSAQILVFPLFGFSPPLSTNFFIACIFTVISIVRGYVLRRAFEFLHIRRPLSPFMQAVIAERYRQIEVEGWDAAHDDEHAHGDMAAAGAVYALADRSVSVEVGEGSMSVSSCRFWPWSLFWLKTTEPRRDFVKAAALIIAEGEKWDRARKPKGGA